MLCLLTPDFEKIPGPGLGVSAFPVAVSKSKKSGSDKLAAPEPSAAKGGLEAGDTRGEVCRASGILSLVSKTKKASPPSPSFIAYSCLTPLTLNSTFFSCGRRRENLPNRTWNGEHARVPSSCSTTITSMAPLSVDGLMEFHVLETDPLMLLTYCMAGDVFVEIHQFKLNGGSEQEGSCNCMYRGIEVKSRNISIETGYSAAGSDEGCVQRLIKRMAWCFVWY